MYIDRNEIEEYPFCGEFYERDVDITLPPSEWADTDRCVLRTMCDIQESAKSKSMASGFASASYNIYFPFNKEKGIEIKRGMYFRGTMYNLLVEGEVI